MASTTNHAGRGPLAALQQYVRKPRERIEVCELCSTRLAPQHLHLLNLDEHEIVCACDACAILFVDSTQQSYRRIPRDLRRLDFVLDDQEWDSLLIPIKLAFFVHDSKAGRVAAQYPSPGGAMESSLELEYWGAIVKKNPVLTHFAPDVEALLVNRISDPAQYYRAPIDHCYRLAGIIRTHWRGLSGGSEVWKQVDEYFRQLSRMCGKSHA
jgi:hypothetical protein